MSASLAAPPASIPPSFTAFSAVVSDEYVLCDDRMATKFEPEAKQARAPSKPLAMLPKLEDHAIIGALPFEHRRCIMESVGENMDSRITPRDQLAVEPDPAVTVVERRLLRSCHEARLGQEGRGSKRPPRSQTPR